MFVSLLVTLIAIAPPPGAEDGVPMSEARVGQGVLAGAPPTQVLKTARFRLVYTEQAKGAAAFLARDIERIRDDVRDVLGRDWPGETEVRLGFGREEYESLALPGGLPPSWAVATA